MPRAPSRYRTCPLNSSEWAPINPARQISSRRRDGRDASRAEELDDGLDAAGGGPRRATRRGGLGYRFGAGAGNRGEGELGGHAPAVGGARQGSPLGTVASRSFSFTAALSFDSFANEIVRCPFFCFFPALSHGAPPGPLYMTSTLPVRRRRKTTR